MLPRRLATTIHAHCRAKLRSKAWYFGTSNVRSLVDNKGTVETARLSSEVSESEYRRIDPSHHRTEPLQKSHWSLRDMIWECSLPCWEEYSADCCLRIDVSKDRGEKV